MPLAIARQCYVLVYACACQLVLVALLYLKLFISNRCYMCTEHDAYKPRANARDDEKIRALYVAYSLHPNRGRCLYT